MPAGPAYLAFFSGQIGLEHSEKNLQEAKNQEYENQNFGFGTQTSEYLNVLNHKNAVLCTTQVGRPPPKLVRQGESE